MDSSEKITTIYDQIEEARADNARLTAELQARIVELETTLQPFAWHGEKLNLNYPDMPDEVETRIVVRVSDLRRAALALVGKESGE